MIVDRMKKNPKLVVASGKAEGEPYVEFHPRGSGRIVDAKFWREVSSLRYPEVWGWESWLCFKAMQLGYETKSFVDVELGLQRHTRHDPKKMREWGKAMYALGYNWKYALGRSLLMLIERPRAGLSLFLGWFVHKDVNQLDIADWVNQMQKDRFWKRVRMFIKHRGRR